MAGIHRTRVPGSSHAGVRVEEDRAGLECWSVDRRPIAFFSGGTAADAASIGKSLEWRKENIFDNHRIGWTEGLAMNPPAWQPDRRAEMMDEEGIDISILYPSMGLTLPRIEDAELSAAHCRAYNNWIRDFCSEAPGRLFPAVTLPWGDVQLTVQEMKRTSGFGARAVMAPNTPPGNMSAHPVGPSMGGVCLPGDSGVASRGQCGDNCRQHPISRVYSAELVGFRDRAPRHDSGFRELLSRWGV